MTTNHAHPPWERRARIGIGDRVNVMCSADDLELYRDYLSALDANNEAPKEPTSPDGQTPPSQPPHTTTTTTMDTAPDAKPFWYSCFGL